ncbi:MULTISPECIES: HlyD family secretion protein [Rhizobium]|uniref:HlyD family secretion protein n=1 Tax=Rhizobium rhododendri TaxID=2506430 RepID=A0ABY8IK15_9HYPH|nr:MULTISPECIES: HlyD family secretion protein [Rhizobium]MBZ5760165.1 HlyD family secretion protein [Rhizobium sp. VS19-DR96]MBZ5766354.1 HlyD family secretion protein [Rhizobium sp. VS19-DR129.2]MBZ5774303.1 HlyD family secretion protein [Rhizobium sp. VS19-DRK62.2]MBZ5785375.1 HlyD family secretion protein [Rhizobium sp. VS19-DR121]MBZ5802974.1 HlyD family secretion protein [Rhizobium sp. VS19-DR181]
MSRLVRSPIEVVAVLAGIGGIMLVLYAWHLPPFRTSVETTDDAYVKGYVTVISPQVSGYVTDVRVKDYESVKQGEVLAKIDDRIYQQKLAQARANRDGQKAGLANSRQQELVARAEIASSQAAVDSVQAGLTRAQLAWERIETLVQKGVSTTSDAETAQATLEQAKAAVNQALAAVEVSRQNLTTIIVNRASLEAGVAGAEAAMQQASIDLQNATIIAPRSGRLGEIGVRLGQYVTAGTQLLALVPEDTWVIANFKETQLDGMQVGQPVAISVDAFGHRRLNGHIQSFSPAAGSEFAVIKPDNATGNFTKVAQRVGVRVTIDPGQPEAANLAPGLSVVVSIDKASKPEAK